MGTMLTKLAIAYADAKLRGDEEELEIAAENLRAEQERVKREKQANPNAKGEWEK